MRSLYIRQIFTHKCIKGCGVYHLHKKKKNCWVEISNSTTHFGKKFSPGKDENPHTPSSFSFPTRKMGKFRYYQSNHSRRRPTLLSFHFGALFLFFFCLFIYLLFLISTLILVLGEPLGLFHCDQVGECTEKTLLPFWLHFNFCLAMLARRSSCIY